MQLPTSIDRVFGLIAMSTLLRVTLLTTRTLVSSTYAKAEPLAGENQGRAFSRREIRQRSEVTVENSEA